MAEPGLFAVIMAIPQYFLTAVAQTGPVYVEKGTGLLIVHYRAMVFLILCSQMHICLVRPIKSTTNLVVSGVFAVTMGDAPAIPATRGKLVKLSVLGVRKIFAASMASAQRMVYV